MGGEGGAREAPRAAGDGAPAAKRAKLSGSGGEPLRSFTRGGGRIRPGAGLPPMGPGAHGRGSSALARGPQPPTSTHSDDSSGDTRPTDLSGTSPAGSACDADGALAHAHAVTSPVSSNVLSDQVLSPLSLAGIARNSGGGKVVYLQEPETSCSGNTPLLSAASAELPPTTPIEELFLLAPRGADENGLDADAFVASLQAEQDIHTIADVNALSNELFAHLAAHYESRGFSYDLWEVLEGVRILPDPMTVEAALAKFSVALPPAQLAKVHNAGLSTVRDVRRMKFGKFLALPLPGKLKATLQLVRERRRYVRTEHPYDVLELPTANAQVNEIVGKLARYHEGVHASWRKSERSQVVTTAITYVDGCRCTKREPVLSEAAGGALLTSPQSPKAYPLASKKAIAGAHGLDNAWCTCPREVVFSVNYELSTPSGSRCSEQNGLGRLAAQGIATSAIREVYVRGVPGVGGSDPNPLFPCGVCENMFRKLSKEVHRVHGGEILLYMFATASPEPTKLIAMPFSEISNRGSQGFKFFVDMEVKG